MSRTLSRPSFSLDRIQHFVFEDASWELYEKLLGDIGNRPIRVTYDDGRMEIMSPLPEHERLSVDGDALLAELSVRSFKIDWFGNRIGFWEYASVLLQHEALHHGQWAVHARLGGWQPPDGWIVNWGL